MVNIAAKLIVETDITSRLAVTKKKTYKIGNATNAKVPVIDHRVKEN